MSTKLHQLPPFFEVRYIDKAGGCERPHTHSSLIVTATSEGHITLQINDGETCLTKGIVAAVGPNILHCVRSYSQGFMGIYVLEIFSLHDTLSEYNSAHLKIFRSQLIHENRFYNDFIHLCVKLLSPIKDSQKIELYSGWLKTLLDKHYASNICGISRDRDLADKIRNILDGHEGNSPPLDEISKTFDLSKERCNRIFRRAYNISIQGYFLNNKATHAKTLLTSTQSLSDIALECGFYDQSHFSRVFKEIFQISPAKYRSLIRETRQSHTRKVT
jgi:AraC-like DNA-binding protein